MTYEPILRGVKILIFLLAACVLSVSFVVLNSRPTSAESLLYKVGCVVSGLLQYECQRPVQQTQPSQSPEPSGSSQQSPAPTTTPPTNNNPTPSSQKTPEPIVMDEELMKDLPDLPAVQGVTTSSIAVAQFPAHIARASVYGVNNTQPAASPAAIVASEEGWKILGMAWYWWAVIIGGVVGLGYGAKLTLFKLRQS